MQRERLKPRSIEVICKVNTGIECELNMKDVALDRRAGKKKIREEYMWCEFK